MNEDLKAALRALEPSACSDKQMIIFEPALTVQQVTALSQAISLKRIADALTGVDFQIIDNWAQTIAWNAGRSFEAGRRQ